MGADAQSAGRNRLAFWTPALLLLAPFIQFVRYNAYGLGKPEILSCVLLIICAGAALGRLSRGRLARAVIAAGCLILFVDIQFDLEIGLQGVGETTALLAGGGVLAMFLFRWSAIVPFLGLITAAMLVTTLVLPSGELRSDTTSAQRTDSTRPFILHLILDEHIGPAGLRAASLVQESQQLEAFFESAGFLVFDGAYAETAETIQSIGHALDLRHGGFDPHLVEASRGSVGWRLTRSKYFEGLARDGYALHIYQSDHLDLCTTGTPVASCHTYASTKLGVLAETPLSTSQRMVVLVGAYLTRSDLWNEVREFYNTVQSTRLSGLPEWTWEQSRVSPIAASLAMARLEDALRGMSRGDAVVAHFLLPHFPYVYDDACRTRSPLEWLERNDTRFYPHRNSPAGRQVRYRQYVSQLGCVRRWVSALVAAIPAPSRDDAIILVHGDHGSRISIGVPRSPSDAMDSYSTLFAIRSPQLPRGLDARRSSMACLLSELAALRFAEPLPAGACTTAQGQSPTFARNIGP